MNILYDIIHILPLSVLLVSFFGRFTGMPESDFIGYIVCLALPVWIIILRHISKKNRLRSIGIVAVFLIVLVIIAGEEGRRVILTEYAWLGWIILISVFSVAAGIFTEKNIWVKRAVSAGLLGYCIAGVIAEWDIAKTTFALICFVVLVHLAEEIQRKWKKDGNAAKKEHLTRISPFILALCIGVLALPAPKEPYGWNITKSVCSNVALYAQKLIGMIVHPSEQYGDVGFSDDGSFLAGLNSSDAEVLDITIGSNSGIVNNLKLIGCISGDFAGNRWIFDTETESRDRMMDTLETVCAVNKYDERCAADYFREIKLSYKNLLYNTRYMFTPSKMRVESSAKDNREFKVKNGSIIAEQKMTFGDTYAASFYTLNYGNPELYKMLDSADEIDEKDWEQSVKSEGLWTKEGYSFEDYRNYVGEIYRKYTKTDGVSDEVGEILNKLKENSSGRYETMKRLEAYLSSMEYTTKDAALPADIADGKSFLDYFLLTSRRGYCMHYATAFVLMARELGVPCRYVHGYAVGTDGAENVRVTQNNAHAWAEVYFDNVGWVAFEPTPGYSNGSSWKPWGNSVSLPQYDGSSYMPVIDSKPDIPVVVPEEKPAQVDIKFILIPVLSAAGFLILFYIISIFASRKRFAKMGFDDKFRYLSKENFRFLNYLGFRIETGETLAEFKDRISKSQKYDLNEHLEFITYREEMQYSDAPICEKQVSDAQKTYQVLREIIKKSKLRYRIMFFFRR